MNGHCAISALKKDFSADAQVSAEGTFESERAGERRLILRNTRSGSSEEVYEGDMHMGRRRDCRGLEKKIFLRAQVLHNICTNGPQLFHIAAR
jgi:hypothetical protein